MRKGDIYGKYGKTKKHPITTMIDESEQLFTSQDDRDQPGGQQQQQSPECIESSGAEDDVEMVTLGGNTLSQGLEEDTQAPSTSKKMAKKPQKKKTPQTPPDADAADDDDDDEDGEEDNDLTQMTQEDPPSQPLKRKKVGKPAKAPAKPRTFCTLSEEQEMDLAEWYQNQDFLYNKKLNAYRDRDRKAQAWSDKATALGVDGEYIHMFY